MSAASGSSVNHYTIFTWPTFASKETMQSWKTEDIFTHRYCDQRPCSLAAQQTLRIHFLGCKNNAEKTRTVTNQAARFFFGLMLAFLYPWLNSLSYSFENSYCCGSMASPMIMIAVLVIFAFFTFDAIVCKVPKIIF